MIIPSLSLRTWAVILCVGMLAAGLQVEERRLARARERVSELALQASNTLAERDSTRQVGESNRRVARMLGDSLLLVERLVAQKAQRQDELDRALQRERLARYAMMTRVESQTTTARGMTQASDVDTSHSVRRARFIIRQAPYTVDADVVLPEVPGTGTMSVRVALDTLRIELRLGCAEANADGISQATLSASGPRWAQLQFERVEQSPALCASPALAHAEPRRWWVGVPVVGAGWMPDHEGRGTWGIFVGVGYALRW